MIKICVICQREFTCAPSDKKVTCGQSACVSERKRQSHLGKSNAWSETARQKKAVQGQTANLHMGTPAARQSPIAGPFETNQKAKYWWVLAPDGQQYHIRNLRKFCRDHADLFAPDPWTNACAGLRQIQAWLMGKTPRMVSQWKGWTLTQTAASPDEGEPGE